MDVEPARRPTLKDVAEAAGVAVSTASRALADNPAVAARTRARIQNIAAGMEYRPNEQARALRRARTNTIGVIVPSLVNHYFATLVTGIQEGAAAAGLTTVIANTREDADSLAASLQVLAGQRVDGVICVPHEDCTDQILALHDAGLPIVLIDREIPSGQVPTVVSDPERGMHDAVRLLAENDALPIGYLSGPTTTSTGRQRLETFRTACTAAGLPEQPVYLGGYEQERGRAGAADLLDRGVTALFAGDSMMTIGVIEECHRRGLAIGEDVAVIGFDRHPVFELQPRPITVIDQDVDAMAALALQTLLAGIDGQPTTNTRMHTPTTLIKRQSTPGALR